MANRPEERIDLNHLRFCQLFFRKSAVCIKQFRHRVKFEVAAAKHHVGREIGTHPRVRVNKLLALPDVNTVEIRRAGARMKPARTVNGTHDSSSRVDKPGPVD